MSYASHVTVGNEYLYKYTAKHNINNVTKIPTVIDESKYYKMSKCKSNSITIGWIGTPATSFFLDSLLPVFKNLHAKHNMKVVLIGARGVDFNCQFIKCIEWNERTEVEMIQTFDIGIMPLGNDFFEKGKCGYKLIQYMSCGVPVVASPIGENNFIVDHDKNGFLANSNDDWEKYLEKLITKEDLRKDFGENGFQKVQEKYTIQIQGPKLVNLFKKIHG